MNRSVSARRSAVLSLAALLALALSAVFGSAIALPLLLVAIVAGAFSAYLYPWMELMRETGPTRHWWQLLLAGGTILGLGAVAEAVGTGSGSMPWVVLVGAYLSGWLLTALGGVLGVVRLFRALGAARTATGA